MLRYFQLSFTRFQHCTRMEVNPQADSSYRNIVQVEVIIDTTDLTSFAIYHP